MSGNQPQRGGRGGGRGDRGGGGGQRGGDRGGRGGGQGRGDFQGGRGRGDFQGGQGRGGFQGDRGRGDFRGGRGGPPGRGQSSQMAFRGGRGGGGGGGSREFPGIYLESAPVAAPDASITAAEDALALQTKGKIIDGLPGRSGFGTKGRAIVLRTNYFKITTAYEAKQPEVPLYRYAVNIRETSVSKPKLRRLFNEIFKHPAFSQVKWATDYATILVTTDKLDLDKMHKGEEMKVTLPSEDGASPQPSQDEQVPDFVRRARDRNTFHFKIRYMDSFSLKQMIDFLQSTSSGALYAGRVDLIQLLNIIVAKAPNEMANVRSVAGNKFYPYNGHQGVEHKDLGDHLEALRGYFSSVRPAISRLLVNINVTSGAFFKAQHLLQVFFNTRNSPEQLEAFMRMLKVEARYVKDGQPQPFMKKTKTIVGFAKSTNTIRVKRFGNANEVKFSYVDRSIPNARAREVTVAQYFKQQHGITLRNANLPVLNVGTRADPQYLPVELCWITPGQAYRRLLSGNQTSEMLRFAARAPNLNAMSIAGVAGTPGNGLRLLRLANPNGNPQADSVQPFGFRVGTDMISVPGRILPSPTVRYGSKDASTANGAWNLKGAKFDKPGKFNRWQVLIINHQGNNGQAMRGPPEETIKALEQALKAYNIQMGPRGPTFQITLAALNMANRPANDKMLKSAFEKAETSRVDMLFIILPEADRWLYARIKFFGDVEHGIGTICSVGSKLENDKGQQMYFGNLALKFNLKGGGVSHSVVNTVSPPIDNNTMLVGIDVTHPSPGSVEGAPSIACVVASVDSRMFQWPGSIRTQTGRQEMVGGADANSVDHLEEMFNERLNLWVKRNQKLPTQIVVYRDGVSEGQYHQVLDIELPSFEKVFEKRYGDKKKWPKIAIIIVGKRHHTRFYPTRKEDADQRSLNPLPGTVVDRGIVGKIVREFYLQAHQGLQGTARPAHYVVIKDDISFSADALEQFTHHLCYLFNRATKAVSICPPAYYADLLCERGRSYLFSKLAENNASDVSVSDGGDDEWTGGVHARLQETTWYV